MNRIKRPFLTILLCNLFLALTVVFFSPLEVLMANAVEFFFPFGNVWWIQLLAALAAALVLSGLMFLLPARAGLVAAGISFALGIAAYVQILFLNGGMVALTGEKIDLTQSRVNLNLVLWIAIFLGILTAVILFGKTSRRGTKRVLCLLSAALLAMQTAGFASSVLTRDLSPKSPDHALSTEGEFVLSRNRNVIVYVLDTADGTYVTEMMTRYPELYDILSGWTWYPNATSRFSRTYPAIPYLLTGNDCDMSIPVDESLDQAYETSSFLKTLSESGVDSRIFTWSQELLSDKADPYIANSTGYQYSDSGNLNLPRLEENLLKAALFKCLPYQFKNAFAYDMREMNTTSFKTLDDDYMYYAYMDSDFNYDLEDALTVTDNYDKAFRFYHLFGTHPGAGWDADLNEIPETEEADNPEALRGCFRNVEEFIRQMKELGIYDSATFIITADHGISGSVDPGVPLEQLPGTAVPIMMVKFPGSDTSKPLQVSRAPVSQDEIFATVELGLGTPATGTGSGNTFSKYAEGQRRDRYYYHTAVRSDDSWDIALLEYLVDGDAEDLANWHYTGKWKNIVYSRNGVSNEQFH